MAGIFVIAYDHIGKVIIKPFECNISPLIFSAQQSDGVSEKNFDIHNICLYNMFIYLFIILMSSGTYNKKKSKFENINYHEPKFTF